MGKVDDKGEPVKTVTIGGKKVEVPIIFILPEETGEKEIERYQHPKVHIESKKVAPLLAGAGAAAGIGAAGKKIGEGVKDTASEGIGAIAEGAKLSETLSAESEEESLEELTDGKLEEVEKLPTKKKKKKKEPLLSNSWEALRQEWGDVLGADKAGSSFPVPKEKDSLDQPEDAVSAKDSENEAILRHALGKPQGVRDTIVAREGEPTREKKIPFESGRAMKAWVSWLQKKKEWDEKEREKDKVIQEQRVARQTHVDEEMSGIGSKQHKEEARAIREGKVAPSRTATIAAERPWDLEKPSSDKKVTSARLLHEFKGFGKAQALKRIKEQQDKRRAEEEKALYVEGGAREKDIANQSKKELEKAREYGHIRHRDGSITEEEGTDEEITAKLNEHNKIPAKERPKFTTADIGDTSKKIGQGEPCWICEAHKLGIGTPVPRSDAEDVGGAYAKHLKEHEGFSATPRKKSWETWLQKNALDASENTGEFKQWGKTPDKRSGRDSKTGRTKIDYLMDMGVYSAGGQAMGKREPQTSRGQADDATQTRLDRYSGQKYHPRQAGGRDSMDFGKLSQHENVLLSPSASDTGWAEGKERNVPKELWDDGDRKVPKGGKRPVEGKPKLGKPAGRTGNEKLLDVMTGNDEAAAESYDKEDERRRGERFGQNKRGQLVTGNRAPKGTKVRKKAWEKWLVRL